MLRISGRRSAFDVQKAMWLIGELGLAHEQIEVGGSFGGLDAPEFLRMNPHGRIPVNDDHRRDRLGIACHHPLSRVTLRRRRAMA